MHCTSLFNFALSDNKKHSNVPIPLPQANINKLSMLVPSVPSAFMQARPRRSSKRGFLLVLSMQRSSSTTLAGVAGKCPCMRFVDEVFHASSVKGSRYFGVFRDFLAATGDRYTSYSSVNSLPLRGIDEFGEFLLDLECPLNKQPQPQPSKRSLTAGTNAETNTTITRDDFCKGRCFVVIKQFEEHLGHEQHERFWSTFKDSITPVILERDVEKRWASSYIAHTAGDWSTSGHNANHIMKLANTTIPEENIEGCKKNVWDEKKLGHPRWLCRFREKHKKWYELLHKRHPDALNLTFEEAIEDCGRPAMRAMLNATRQFTPAEIAHVQQQTMPDCALDR